MVQALKKKLKSEKGFTLIELLAVIVILGIIAAIAIPTIGNIIDNSKMSAIRADAQQILNGAKLYSADHGSSTTTLTPTDLANYVENESTFPTTGTTAYSVDFSNGTPRLSGVGTKDGKSITFTNATITGINAAAKDAIAISN